MSVAWNSPRIGYADAVASTRLAPKRCREGFNQKDLISQLRATPRYFLRPTYFSYSPIDGYINNGLFIHLAKLFLYPFHQNIQLLFAFYLSFGIVSFLWSTPRLCYLNLSLLLADERHTIVIRFHHFLATRTLTWLMNRTRSRAVRKGQVAMTQIEKQSYFDVPGMETAIWFSRVVSI